MLLIFLIPTLSDNRPHSVYRKFDYSGCAASNVDLTSARAMVSKNKKYTFICLYFLKHKSNTTVLRAPVIITALTCGFKNEVVSNKQLLLECLT